MFLQKFPKFYNEKLFCKSQKECCPRRALALVSTEREGGSQPASLDSTMVLNLKCQSDTGCFSMSADRKTFSGPLI